MTLSIKEQIIQNKIENKIIDNQVYFNKLESELLEKTKNELLENLKDIILFAYPNTTGTELNEENTKIIQDFKVELNEIIQEYRNNNLTYKVIMYSPFDYTNFIGIDTFNKEDPIKFVRLNGHFTRNSCIHFKSDKYIEDYKENINPKLLKYYNNVKDNLMEFYPKFSLEDNS